jgi:hypothetical protein
MRLSFVLARVTSRTGIAIWRHRFVALIAAMAVGALGLYELTYARAGVPVGDCADATMASMTTSTEDAARAAYACLSPRLRSSTEAAWIADMQQRQTPRGRVSRIGDQPTQDGGRVVFFLVVTPGQDVGYIVYLDPMGKVKTVE